MQKNTYVIWVNTYRYSPELFCLYTGTFEEADAFLVKLRDSDDKNGDGRSKYWRTEPHMVMAGVCEEENLIE